jgi:tRNA1Val (adenine37-N6)-methyltransferase
MQNDVTQDSLFDGKLSIKQARKGYRFSIDAVILASSIQPKPQERIIDLGTGCGVVPLIVAFRHPKAVLFGVEIQPDLAEMARLNTSENGFTETIQIICGDIRSIRPGRFDGPVDRVVSNPPFRRAASGRINPNPQRAIARHEIHVTLPILIQTASCLLRTAGRFVVIFTSERLVELIQEMRTHQLEPKSVRFIHSRHDSESKLVMMTGVKRGKPGLKIGAPIFVYNPDGSYTDEVERMFHP